MPMKATLRNLTRLSSLGLLDDTKPHNCVTLVVERLENHEEMRAAGIHPLSVLLAQREYEGFQQHRKRALKNKRRAQTQAAEAGGGT